MPNQIVHRGPLPPGSPRSAANSRWLRGPIGSAHANRLAGSLILQTPIRLIIADDHAVFREGLKALLATYNRFEVVAEVERSGELEAIVSNTPCDVVLLDLQMDQWVMNMAFREMGNLPKSLEDFNRAVELNPGLDTYFQRATTYQSMGDHAKALADLDQVVSLFPTSPMGYLARAKSREATGDLAGARSDRETGRSLEDRAPGQ